MKIIDSDDLNILNLYIAIKNAGYSTDLFVENIKDLEYIGIGQEILSKQYRKG